MKIFLNSHVKQIVILLKLMLLPLCLMSITRVLFFLVNKAGFPTADSWDFIYGAWFDCITMGLFYLPFVVVFLLPLPIRNKKRYRNIAISMYVLITLIIVGLNLTDVAYFKYTQKRSTLDLLSFLTTGNDIFQLVGALIIDFWYLFLLLFVFCYLIIRYYRWVVKDALIEKIQGPRNFYFRTIVLLICVGFNIFIGRGGFVFKPVGILEASQFVDTSKTALVLNTPFTFVKSIGQASLKEVQYYQSMDEAEKWFNPVKTSQPQGILPDGTNVVILILESFGKEFIGYYDAEKTYTPFLDSLLEQSLTFKSSLANGKKSIEAVPSIFASIPSLQDQPYISSKYNSNRVIGLPELLKRHGYESAFFHGATNGSMRFDAFANYIGFDQYFGRNEYNNEKHADASWGVLDEYFNPWTAKQISNLKEPFLATLFTLSSHHPFYIPEHRRSEVINGPQPLCASISYGDLSLKLFFDEAKKQPWFENTVFVICADHSPGSETSFYQSRTQLYQIPIAFYHPAGKLPKEMMDIIFQQVDIYPTLLDMLNIKDSYYSFGNSLYEKVDRFAVSYLEGNYFYFENDRMLVFSQNQARNLYGFHSRDQSMEDELVQRKEEATKYTQRLKAIVQRYNHDLIHNETTAGK